MKIERKYLAHYVDAAMPGQKSTPKYVRIGQDLEEYSPELSANVEKKQNILGETNVILTSYEKSGSVETYYAQQGEALFERLQDIVDHCRSLDQCSTTVVEVHLWKTVDATKGYPAVLDDAVIEVTSYGGDNTGYQIPFTLHYAGKPRQGYFKLETGVFTPAE